MVHSVRWFVQLSHPFRLQPPHHSLLLLRLAEQEGRARPQDCKNETMQIAGATIILFVVDLLFLLVEIPVWNQEDLNNPVWQTIHGLHSFGIFLFVIINILKLILLVITIRANSAAPSQPQ